MCIEELKVKLEESKSRVVSTVLYIDSSYTLLLWCAIYRAHAIYREVGYTGAVYSVLYYILGPPINCVDLIFWPRALYSHH